VGGKDKQDKNERKKDRAKHRKELDRTIDQAGSVQRAGLIGKVWESLMQDQKNKK